MLALIGTLLGGLLTLAGGYWSTYADNRRKAKSLLSALKGEIFAVVTLFELREHLHGFKNGVCLAEEKSDDCLYHFPISENDTRVYVATVANVGILTEPFPFKIARFYALLAALQSDMVEVEKGSYDALSIEQKQKLARQMFSFATELVELGNWIVHATEHDDR